MPVQLYLAFFISLDKLTHNGLFLPIKIVFPVCIYLPKVAVAILSHDIAKSRCLLVRLKHVYLKLQSEVVSNERESALLYETGFFRVLIINIE